MLQSIDVLPQYLAIIEVQIEAGEILLHRLQKLSRRKVRVRREALGGFLMNNVHKLAEKLLYSRCAIESNDVVRQLVGDAYCKNSFVSSDLPCRFPHRFLRRFLRAPVLKKTAMLLPGHV